MRKAQLRVRLLEARFCSPSSATCAQFGSREKGKERKWAKSAPKSNADTDTHAILKPNWAQCAVSTSLVRWPRHTLKRRFALFVFRPPSLAFSHTLNTLSPSTVCDLQSTDSSSSTCCTIWNLTQPFSSPSSNKTHLILFKWNTTEWTVKWSISGFYYYSDYYCLFGI